MSSSSAAAELPANDPAVSASPLTGGSSESQPQATSLVDEVEALTASSESLNITALSVDNDPSDTDSAFGESSVLTTTTSICASAYDFVEENGRTYHRFRAGQYELPNDEREQDRLDMQHQLFLLTLFGELYTAPIKDLPRGLHNVLDLGTGTGIWAIEFANLFPSAKVVGTDLSPIQPKYVPPNCQFVMDDAEDTWEFSHKFDYIHGRALATCFKSHFGVIRSAFNALHPGGYLEMQDCIFPFTCIDDTMKGTTLERWIELILKGCKALGKDWTRVSKYKRYFEDAGFVDVVEKRYDWPFGTWAKGQRMKMLGMWCREDFLSGIQGLTLAVLTRGLGMSIHEIEVLLAGVRDDIKTNKVHVYMPVRVVYGRKPLSTD